MSRRIGRWTYNSDSTRYGEAGWHLNGSPLVLDFMPGLTDCEPSRGMYLLYNWPGRPNWQDHMISTHLRPAMREIEEMWDEYRARAER